jgi:hypothetical protein
MVDAWRGEARDPPSRESGDELSVARRRWLVGAEPIFEGGWFHKGERVKGWNVESELVALSLLGDVTVDLWNSKSIPSEVHLEAYAIGRDVNVLVGPGTHVELTGRSHNDHLNNEVPSVPEAQSTRVLRIEGHTLLGDVVVRVHPGSQGA